MTAEMILAFAILFGAVVLFATERVRPEIVALLVVVALVVTGLSTAKEACAGLGDPSVWMIGALFVVGEGLVRTGLAHEVGDAIVARAGASEARLVALLMASAALLSAVLSSTGVVAIFLPIVLGIGQKTGLPPSRLLLPLAFAALIGGTLTLIATPPNLVVNAALEQARERPFGFFGITPLGLLLAGVAIGYCVLVGRRLLPASPRQGPGATPPSIRALSDVYGLPARQRLFRVEESSRLVGSAIGEAQLRRDHGLTVVALLRSSRRRLRVLAASADALVRGGDVLYAFEDEGVAEASLRDLGFVPEPFDEAVADALTDEIGVAELLLPPDSELVGRTLWEIAWRSRRQLVVLGIKRGGTPIVGSLVRETLREGDVVLVAATWQRLRELRSDPRDVVVLTLPAEHELSAPSRSRRDHALLILAFMVVAMTAELAPNVAVVLAAALAMAFTRCVDVESAYRSIHWPNLLLIAGMLPLASALERTGAAGLLARGLVGGLGGGGPYALLAVVFGITVLLSLVLSNTATAALMAPVALEVAASVGLSPRPFALIVAVAASCAFATPVSSPVNTLVMAPGGYRFADYARLGFPLVLLCLLVSVLVAPLVYPFHVGAAS
ncbi:MAG: SLC13 family permease [Polyangiales bacterium]